MATLTIQDITRSGLEATYAAAASGGDKFANNGRVMIHIKNGDASDHTVTVDIPKTVDGQAVTDISVTVTASEERFIGPFPPSIYNDSDGYVNLTYDAVTSVTIGILRLS